MDKTEFLNTLRSQISGQMHSARVTEHMRYYEEYIDSQMRSGRSEAEVLEELGDPRLIARTLLATDSTPSGGIYDGDGDYSGYSGEEERSGQEYNGRQVYKSFHFDTWYSKVIAGIVVVILLFVLFSILKAVLPFFLILALILYVVSYFKKRQ